MAFGYYERKILQNILNTGISCFANVGYGFLHVPSGDWQYGIIRGGILGGRGAHHYEGSYGAVIETPAPSDGMWRVNQSFSLGWRYEQPKNSGRFIARFGVGYPELIYVSVGVGF